jgi:hypothetical protein
MRFVVSAINTRTFQRFTGLVRRPQSGNEHEEEIRIVVCEKVSLHGGCFCRRTCALPTTKSYGFYSYQFSPIFSSSTFNFEVSRMSSQPTKSITRWICQCYRHVEVCASIDLLSSVWEKGKDQMLLDKTTCTQSPMK